MKRTKGVIALVGIAMMVAMLMMAVAAVDGIAADKMLKATATDVVQATGRNGANYTRVIIQEKRRLNGIEYEAGVPVMFFGAMAEKGSTLEIGSDFKAIVSEREYRGSKSYTVIQLLTDDNQ